MSYIIRTTRIDDDSAVALVEFSPPDAEEKNAPQPSSGPMFDKVIAGATHVAYLDVDGNFTASVFQHTKHKQSPVEISVVGPSATHGGYERRLHVLPGVICGSNMHISSSMRSSHVSIDACMDAASAFCGETTRVVAIASTAKGLPPITSGDDMQYELQRLYEKGVHALILSEKASNDWVSTIFGPAFSGLPADAKYVVEQLDLSPSGMDLHVFWSMSSTASVGADSFCLSVSRALFGRAVTVTPTLQGVGVSSLGHIVGFVGNIQTRYSRKDNMLHCAIDPKKKNQYIVVAMYGEHTTLSVRSAFRLEETTPRLITHGEDALYDVFTPENNTVGLPVQSAIAAVHTIQQQSPFQKKSGEPPLAEANRRMEWHGEVASSIAFCSGVVCGVQGSSRETDRMQAVSVSGHS